MIPGSDLQIMKTVLDYRKRARECRALARLISLREQRDQLLETARIWDSLAETREKLVRNRPEADVGKAAPGSGNRSTEAQSPSR
jgi:hypothetical protein